MIPTASICIYDKYKNPIRCRAIIDTGSTKNFIIDDLAARLKLPKHHHYIPIGTLNELSTISKYSIISTIKSYHNNYTKELEFFAIPSITSLIPEQLINRNDINIPANIALADPEFHIPKTVQILIGAGTALASLCIGQIKLSNASEPDLILQKTHFEWIIGGNLPINNNVTPIKCHMTRVLNDLSRFWEIDECKDASIMSQEETLCKNHFTKYVHRNPAGRYEVALPFNDKKELLGESYQMALKRLNALNRKFDRNPNFKEQYTRVLQEYIDLGYMQRVSCQTKDGFYLPHQAVMKETSATTKIRVVFDASAASNSGISLNEALLAGPTIQDDIFSLLLRFRLHNHVLTGDIEKMYLQILIREEDQKYLRILWKESDTSIATYQFNRLIFGLKPASYIATQCLHQLAEDERQRFPLATMVLKRDLYVDDLLTGADTIKEVLQLHREITELLQLGGFNLRQCASNTNEILSNIPESRVNLQLQNHDSKALKTLGLYWDSFGDKIVYTVNPARHDKITKRIIFSEVAKIYDPLGLLNPVIVNAKLLIQELWKLQLNWDESLSMEMHDRWNNFLEQLSLLNQISFNRKILHHKPVRVELHGFCDASQRAFGACLYLRSIDEWGNIQVGIYCAKSRVAPIKTPQTISRLELCAALLLANLQESVRRSMHITPNQVYFWSDSMIVLHWIRTEAHLLKAFVSSRVSEIQSKTNIHQWRHVRTHDNPADMLSRGMLPVEFLSSSFWKQGPAWISQREEEWPLQTLLTPADISEIRKPKCLHLHLNDISIFEKYSSYSKLQRIMAYCLRFTPSNKHLKGPLTVSELEKASVKILRMAQSVVFEQEIRHIKKGELRIRKSRFANLSPFIDQDGLLRVGGRLHNSHYPYEKKHPVILPKSHHITNLIILQAHLRNLHSGVQATLYSLREKYWPIDGRNQVRKCIRSCVICTRAKPKIPSYTMGDLPRNRILPTRPFTNTGVDYCGPFYIKEKKHRNRNKVKIYVAVFICFVTKAVHLEIVSDLTTKAFLAALKRFIARRGKCSNLYSDNGTNFVGAHREMRELYDLLKSEAHNEKVQRYLANDGISWHFNPPASPHLGGLWEAAVKSFKHHLKRVIGVVLFTFEQFNTLVIEIEAILNSRPLTPLSADPNDLTPLTPAHFLIGDTFASIPEHDFTDTVVNRLSMWQHIQKVKQDFWKRWNKEYVNELHIRHKWLNGSHTIRQGSIVILRDENLPPMQWRMGRVIEEIKPKSNTIDENVRVVKIKTATGEVSRAVKRLVLLPTDNSLDHNC